MICLTGDVHHSSLRSDDFAYCKGTEIEACREMSLIAQRYEVKTTFFFTGRCAKESPEIIKEISMALGVEIGGHNYFAFKPRLPFKIYYRLTGIKNGPAFFQRFEVRKTLSELSTLIGKPILSWRDHGYRHDKNTFDILSESGIEYVSDTLSNDFGQPRWNGKLFEVPINTIPDHEYVYHGKRRPGAVNEEALKKSVFKTSAMTPDQWLNKIKEQIEEIERRQGVAVILAHPACMEVMDNFRVFEKLCDFISNYKTVNMNGIRV